MKKLGILLCGLSILWGCQEDFFPSGLYGEQVEWILAADSSRTWDLVRKIEAGNEVPLESCIDSLRFYVERVSTTSLEVYELEYEPGCSEFDTTFYGQMRASTARSGNTNLFTDTLRFENGQKDYLLIEFIEPGRVVWRDRASETVMDLRSIQ